MKHIVFLLLLAGCGLSDPRGLYALSQVNPAHDDPGGLAVAIAPPSALRLMPKGTRLIMTLQHGDAAPEKQIFTLVPAAAEGPVAQAQVFTLRDTDLPALRAMQAQNDQRLAAGQQSTLALSLEADACRTVRELPQDARGSVWIRTRADADFAPLLVDTPLAKIPGWEDAANKILPCTP
jgi:hypothetical protein